MKATDVDRLFGKFTNKYRKRSKRWLQEAAESGKYFLNTGIPCACLRTGQKEAVKRN